MAKIKTCTYHCRTCGEHFSSLAAFDLHRVGAWDDRGCDTTTMTRYKLTDGVCEINDGEKRDVKIWTSVDNMPEQIFAQVT